ncbi:Isochorismatase [Bacillus mycoides]|nr:Isochorismatase [Bacillus mycoides]
MHYLFPSNGLIDILRNKKGVKIMDTCADILIVIDLQNGVCYSEEHLFDLQNLLTKVNKRISSYRKSNKPIIFVQHCDDDLVPEKELWAIHTDLDVQEQDFFVRKTHANSFYKTNLKEILDQLSVHRIEFCGAQTEYCMDATIKFAHGLGYENFMVQKTTSTLNNPFMSAKETINFYENIWNHRFLKLIKDEL